MLEMLAVKAPSTEDFLEWELAQLREALIYAVGELRERRAMPVLKATLLHEGAQFPIMAAAAAAIAYSETDEVVDVLFSILDEPSHSEERRRAVFKGLGSCRRAAVAVRLARELGARPGEETAFTIVRALGRLGDVRKMSSEAGKDEEHLIRAVVPKALIRGFVDYFESTMVRKEAEESLAKVGDWSVLELIWDAREGTSPEVSEGLYQMSRRCKRSWDRRRAR
jgi:HEAT repeat protein